MCRQLKRGYGWLLRRDYVILERNRDGSREAYEKLQELPRGLDTVDRAHVGQDVERGPDNQGRDLLKHRVHDGLQNQV